MAIKYNIFESHLTPIGSNGEDKFAARVNLTNSIDLETIASRIVDMGTTVRKPDILAVLENVCKVCETALLDGTRVNLGGHIRSIPQDQGALLPD